MYGPDLRGPWIYACPGTVTRAKPRPGQRGTEDKSALGSHENELWDLQDALDGSGEAGRRHGERMLDIRPETTFFWVILRPCTNYHKAYAWQWVEIYQKYLEGRNAADQYCNELTKLLLYPREQLYVLWSVCHNHACGLLMFPHRRNRESRWTLTRVSGHASQSLPGNSALIAWGVQKRQAYTDWGGQGRTEQGAPPMQLQRAHWVKTWQCSFFGDTHAL